MGDKDKKATVTADADIKINLNGKKYNFTLLEARQMKAALNSIIVNRVVVRRHWSDGVWWI